MGWGAGSGCGLTAAGALCWGGRTRSAPLGPFRGARACGAPHCVARAAHLNPKRLLSCGPSMTQEMLVMGQRLFSTAPATARAAAWGRRSRCAARSECARLFTPKDQRRRCPRASSCALACELARTPARKPTRADPQPHAILPPPPSSPPRPPTCGAAPLSSFDSRNASMASSNAANWLVGYVWGAAEWGA